MDSDISAGRGELPVLLCRRARASLRICRREGDGASFAAGCIRLAAEGWLWGLRLEQSCDHQIGNLRSPSTRTSACAPQEKAPQSSPALREQGSSDDCTRNSSPRIGVLAPSPAELVPRHTAEDQRNAAGNIRERHSKVWIINNNIRIARRAKGVFGRHGSHGRHTRAHSARRNMLTAANAPQRRQSRSMRWIACSWRRMRETNNRAAESYPQQQTSGSVQSPASRRHRPAEIASWLPRRPKAAKLE